MVAAEKTEVGKKGFAGDTEDLDEVKTRQTYQNNGSDFDYSDMLWYSAKVSSQSEANYRYRGSIFHAKMVVTFQLPENVRYWDEDDLMDDYYLEYTDKSGKKQTFTMAEAKAAGWGIELTQRYFAGDVAPAENTADGLTRADSATKRGGETLVFEITTPAESGFDYTDDKTYVAGYHPAGYFNGTLNFKIKTRIDNLELPADTDRLLFQGLCNIRTDRRQVCHHKGRSVCRTGCRRQILHAQRLPDAEAGRERLCL